MITIVKTGVVLVIAGTISAYTIQPSEENVAAPQEPEAYDDLGASQFAVGEVYETDIEFQPPEEEWQQSEPAIDETDESEFVVA